MEILIKDEEENLKKKNKDIQKIKKSVIEIMY